MNPICIENQVFIHIKAARGDGTCMNVGAAFRPERPVALWPIFCSRRNALEVQRLLRPISSHNPTHKVTITQMQNLPSNAAFTQFG